jgi:hypothetical protein
MVMMEALLDEARDVNERLSKSMDEFAAELAATRAWARTVGTSYPTPPSAARSHERALRPGTTSRGPV